MEKKTENKNLRQSIGDFLEAQGYRLAAVSEKKEILIFMRLKGEGIDMVTLVDMVNFPKLTEEFITRTVSDFSGHIEQRISKSPGNLSLVIAEHSENALNLGKKHYNYWYLDAKDNRMYLFENHDIKDVHNIRRPLEQWILEKGIQLPETKGVLIRLEFSLMAMILLLVNVIFFFLQTVGVLKIEMLRIYPEALANGEAYRLLTYMFAHGDGSHILFNMVILMAISGYVKKFYSDIGLLWGYLSSGVVAALVSMAYSVQTGRNYGSVGASGAIYGLMGMAFIYLLLRRKEFDVHMMHRILMAGVCLVCSSLSSPGTDYMGHFGGFLFGVFFGCIYMFGTYIAERLSHKKEDSDEN